MSRSWGDGNEDGDARVTRYMSLASPLRLTKLDGGPPNSG